jgi:hypothetical protein
MYDELTLRRIERAAMRQRVVPERRHASGARRAVGGGALLTAVTLGIQEALDPAEDEPIVEEVPGPDADDLEAVTLFLVPLSIPNGARLSRAKVRPWLLEG